MQNNTHKWNGKRKRSVSHTTVKPATPITAFFKPVSLTIKVFIPFTVPTLNHLNHHNHHVHQKHCCPNVFHPRMMNYDLYPDPLTLVQLTSTDPEVQEENETEEEVSQALPQALSHTPNPNSNYQSGRSSFRCSPSIHG